MINDRLIQRIFDAKRTFGDDLGDLNSQDLTYFLRQKGFAKNGFKFAKINVKKLTFSVPKQDPARWYKSDGWLLKEKRRIAEEIARKHDLQLYMPLERSNLRYHFLFVETHPKDETRVHFAEAHPKYITINIDDPFVDNDLLFDDICGLYDK